MSAMLVESDTQNNFFSQAGSTVHETHYTWLPSPSLHLPLSPAWHHGRKHHDLTPRPVTLSDVTPASLHFSTQVMCCTQYCAHLKAHSSQAVVILSPLRVSTINCCGSAAVADILSVHAAVPIYSQQMGKSGDSHNPPGDKKTGKYIWCWKLFGKLYCLEGFPIIFNPMSCPYFLI